MGGSQSGRDRERDFIGGKWEWMGGVAQTAMGIDGKEREREDGNPNLLPGANADSIL